MEIVEEIKRQGSFRSRDSQEDTILKSYWNADLLVHKDLFKYKTSERMGQKRHA